MRKNKTKTSWTNPTKSSQSTPTFEGFVSSPPATSTLLTVSTFLAVGDHHVATP